jgi:hypothetical protein
MTPEQRAALLAKAARAPKARTEIRERLMLGATSLSDVLKMAATDDVIGEMKVSELLACLPGVGKAGVAQIMERLGIPEARRVRSLPERQRDALLGEPQVQVPAEPASHVPSAPEPARDVIRDAVMISAQDLIVKADHHQIYIWSPAGVEEYEGFDVDDGWSLAFNDATESGRFVGVQPGFIAMVTPGQWNFRTPLRLEIWSAEPPDDRGNWDHEVDVDFQVPDGRVNFMQSGAGIAETSVDVPAGRYRARISGRGFTEVGHAGADGDDSYRLRLWIRDQQQDPAVRKRWPGWDQWR